VTIFISTINGLKEQQWGDIFNVALSFAAGKQTILKKDVPPSETESDDEVLVDPRYADM
jgi:hypothetical protein